MYFKFLKISKNRNTEIFKIQFLKTKDYELYS